MVGLGRDRGSAASRILAGCARGENDMRRKRRSKGTWFPNLGTSGAEGNDDDDDSGRWFAFEFLANDQTSHDIILDLTFDKPFEDELDGETQTGRSLSDIIGSEYILRRIVGKFFAAIDQSRAGGAATACLLTCGFFVARSEDSSTETLGDAKPIGANTAVELRENYSPAAASTVREPWIWRRRWILSNPRFVNATTENIAAFGTGAFPPTTAAYGSVADGPHIDAKTIRRVGQDSRLWFAASCRILNVDWVLPFAPDFAFPIRVNCHLDYRIFGMLRKARQTGNF